MALDSAGNVHVTGTTQSGDFPTTAGAFDTTYNSSPRPNNIADGFYAKLSPSGGLLYGTYFGGRGFEEPHGIDVDAAGNAYIVGETTSTTTNDAAGRRLHAHRPVPTTRPSRTRRRSCCDSARPAP